MGVANACATSCALVTNLILVRSLTPTEYGRLGSFLGSALLIGLLLGFGLTTKVAGDLAVSRNRLDQAGRTVSNLLIARVLTLLLTLLGGAAVSLIAHERLWFLAACIAVAQNLTDFNIGVQQGLGRLTWVAGGLVAPPLLQLALVLVFTPEEASLVLLLQAIAFLAPGVVLLAKPLALTGGLSGLRIDPRYIRHALAGAGGIYTGILFQLAFGVLPVSALGAFGHFEAAGVLFFALSLVRIPSTLVTPLVAASYYPLLCHYASRPDFPASFGRLFDFSLRCIAVVGITAGAFCLAWPDAPILLLAPKYAAAAPVVTLMSPLTILLVEDGFLTHTLWGLGRLRPATLILLARLMTFLLLVVVLGWLLPGEMALVDVALAMLVSGSVSWSVQIMAVRRFANWATPLPALVASYLSAVAVVAGARIMLEGALPPISQPLLLVAILGPITVLTATAAGLASGIRPAVLKQ